MKRKHKQMIIIWVGLLAGILLFRGGWMTYAGLGIFLLDLGLVEGTQVRCLQKSPAGDPIAYDIRGAVIALRSDDSKFVIVEEQSASLNHSFQEDK